MRTPYRWIVVAVLLAAGVFAAPAGAADPRLLRRRDRAVREHDEHARHRLDRDGRIDHVHPLPGHRLQRRPEHDDARLRRPRAAGGDDAPERLDRHRDLHAGHHDVQPRRPRLAPDGDGHRERHRPARRRHDRRHDPHHVHRRPATRARIPSATSPRRRPRRSRRPPARRESWVPPGTATSLSTDPTGSGVATKQQSEIAGARIQAPAAGVFASLKRTAGAFACPKGAGLPQRRLDRGARADRRRPGHLRPAAALHAALGRERSSRRSRPCATWPCSTSRSSARRCRSSPAAARPPRPRRPSCPASPGSPKQADGDFSAVLVQNHNGYMR